MEKNQNRIHLLDYGASNARKHRYNLGQTVGAVGFVCCIGLICADVRFGQFSTRQDILCIVMALACLVITIISGRVRHQ
jgi:hypothetical protein